MALIKTELGQMIDKNADSLSEEMKEHRNKTAVELAVISNTLQSTVNSVDTGMIQGFTTTSSELTSHDIKLDSLTTQMIGNFNGVTTDLNSISDDICKKIEEHDKTANKLMEIVCLHHIPNGPCYRRYRRLETCSLPGHD